MVNDIVSRYRVARLSLFLPPRDGLSAHYALLVNEVTKGIPRGTVLLDGVLPSCPSKPHLEDLLALLDSALHREMLID